ncbi:hypothetical protein LMG27177_02276 [Paraburkholderia fynbosensis]|uniref:Uncharacterized protein n=1 Tax=Paraburkholderia fynbosensis TaxID=1200993 RepID=A0A6J5FYS4_9BURK|nr:hypothetical protein LMG27177_02276 [Paraburkholderia fynbosensis]
MLPASDGVPLLRCRCGHRSRGAITRLLHGLVALGSGLGLLLLGLLPRLGIRLALLAVGFANLHPLLDDRVALILKCQIGVAYRKLCAGAEGAGRPVFSRRVHCLSMHRTAHSASGFAKTRRLVWWSREVMQEDFNGRSR